jgi:diguanylate cyclase (GGDEF)-like protein
MILEMVARGEPLAATTDRLCAEVERRLNGVLCSVLLVDRDGILHPLSGPSLPPQYSAALDGLIVGPETGSCGAAAYFGESIGATDVETDPRWANFKDLALRFGLRACWSSPIRGEGGRVIGTFAFYYRQKQGPGPMERRIVDTCVNLCAIAIERHDRVQERERKAYVDDLTLLPNRAAFNAALAGLSCDRPGEWGLLVVDLDNLKIMNDTFGHGSGDCLLQIVARRMSDCAAPDSAFRLGGDEFAVLVQAPEALRDIDRAAAALLETLGQPADCAGNVVVPRATMGVAVVSAGDRAPETVRQNADFALYHAKETGRGGFVRYWPGIGTTMLRRIDAVRDVDAALREDRVEAHYQPIVKLDTREIVGLEALCRLRVGDRIVPAATFFEAMSDAHVAGEVTARMLSLVAADVRGWLDLGIPFQHVGINVSSADFHGGKLQSQIAAAFGKHGVPLKHIILEVTEAVYLGKRDRIVHAEIQAIRSRGLRMALDDFGTGYASLTHLLTVPVDVIKIDKSFVAQMTPGAPSATIVEAILFIARKLDMRVVAEGVETEDQANQLRKLGCHLAQGFLFSQAVNAEATTSLLLRRAQGVTALAAPDRNHAA